MELIFALAMKFWQWTLVSHYNWMVNHNVLDKRRPNKLKFTYTEFIKLFNEDITKNKGFFKGIVMVANRNKKLGNLKRLALQN